VEWILFLCSLRGGQLCLQKRQVALDCGPNRAQVDGKIAMQKTVAHPVNVAPRYLGMLIREDRESRPYPACRLAYHLDIANHRVLALHVGDKRLLAHPGGEL